MRVLIVLFIVLLTGCLTDQTETPTPREFTVSLRGPCDYVTSDGRPHTSLNRQCKLREIRAPEYCNHLERRRSYEPVSIENGFDQLDCLVTLAGLTRSEDPCGYLRGNNQLVCEAAARRIETPCKPITDDVVKESCLDYVGKLRSTPNFTAYQHPK